MYDVVTLLADLRLYDFSVPAHLDSQEKERERTLKTDYFKKRFIVSRAVMKPVLQHLVGETMVSHHLLERGENGRLKVHGRPDIFISLSYSGTCIALTLGKQKTGCDIEMVRPLDIRKIRSCSLFDQKPGNEKEQTLHFLQQWTMVEAYAKLRDMNLYPLLKERYYFNDTHFVSYQADRHSVLSLASDSPLKKNVLLWADPVDWPTISSSDHPGGERFGGRADSGFRQV